MYQDYATRQNVTLILDFIKPHALRRTLRWTRDITGQILIVLTIILIILSAFFQPIPPAQAMKRESRLAPASFAEALDLSRDYGYRSVNWAAVGMEG